MPASTRDEIVAATTELFRRKGFNATSLADITNASGATTGSIYHFFGGGKEELARVVITESGRAYGELFEAIAADSSGPGEAVEAFFDGAAAVLAETGFVDVCPIGTVAREVASTHPRLREAAGEVFDAWVMALALRVEAEGVAGNEARSVAAAVIAMLEGGFILARTQQDADLLRRLGSHAKGLVNQTLALIT